MVCVGCVCVCMGGGGGLKTVDIDSFPIPRLTYPGKLCFVRAIGCSVKRQTVPTIYFQGTGPRNSKGSEINSNNARPTYLE